LIAALFLSRCGVEDEGRETGPAERAAVVHAQVIDVYDGDTIEVELRDGSREDVRYIGIDTPGTAKPDAPADCAADEAAGVNEALVGEETVTLRFGPERRDRYDRLLAYVYTRAPGGTSRFVNAVLVRRGLARPLTIAPNDARAPLFERLAAKAAHAARGIWGACPV